MGISLKAHNSDQGQSYFESNDRTSHKFPTSIEGWLWDLNFFCFLGSAVGIVFSPPLKKRDHCAFAGHSATRSLWEAALQASFQPLDSFQQTDKEGLSLGKGTYGAAAVSVPSDGSYAGPTGTLGPPMMCALNWHSVTCAWNNVHRCYTLCKQHCLLLLSLITCPLHVAELGEKDGERLWTWREVNIITRSTIIPQGN